MVNSCCFGVLMKKSSRETVGAVIAAAGASQRMDSVDKMFAPLGGRPLLAQVIDVFQRCDSVDRIVVVLSSSNLERGRRLVAKNKWSKVTDVCPGGKRRQDSVKNGLSYLSHCQWVIVHDGARPLVTMEMIEQGLDAAAETGAAVAAVPVTDTIKVADERQLVSKTLERHSLWAVQTPQVFRFAIINEAYSHAPGDVTDDAMLVERLGHKVKLYKGSYDNIKVTTLGDLALARLLWPKHE